MDETGVTMVGGVLVDTRNTVDTGTMDTVDIEATGVTVDTGVTMGIGTVDTGFNIGVVRKDIMDTGVGVIIGILKDLLLKKVSLWFPLLVLEHGFLWK